MPYIKQEDREPLDYLLEPLINRFNGLSKDDRDGQMNYVISNLMKYCYDVKYKELNAAIGVLECAKLELYRHIIGPYEETKIKENGDI